MEWMCMTWHDHSVSYDTSHWNWCCTDKPVLGPSCQVSRHSSVLLISSTGKNVAGDASRRPISTSWGVDPGASVRGVGPGRYWGHSRLSSGPCSCPVPLDGPAWRWKSINFSAPWLYELLSVACGVWVDLPIAKGVKIKSNQINWVNKMKKKPVKINQEIVIRSNL